MIHGWLGYTHPSAATLEKFVDDLANHIESNCFHHIGIGNQKWGQSY
jgi:hypothetical protein